jgi:hypothetical protein
MVNQIISPSCLKFLKGLLSLSFVPKALDHVFSARIILCPGGEKMIFGVSSEKKS